MIFTVKAEKEKTMTNREWLNGLTNDEFADWLCDAMYNEELSRELGTDIYTGISQIKFAYTDSRLGLKQWLGERKNEE